MFRDRFWISLAISVAFFFSLAVTLGYPGDPLWWELATLVSIMLLGHWIEMRSILQASGARRELAKLLPSSAQRIVGDRIDDVPISELREGDLVLVRPGASVPADGVVQTGKSDVNESMITGESIPVAPAQHPGGEWFTENIRAGPTGRRVLDSTPISKAPYLLMLSS
jgi:Cu2+-exporting ATPase